MFVDIWWKTNKQQKPQCQYLSLFLILFSVSFVVFSSCFNRCGFESKKTSHQSLYCLPGIIFEPLRPPWGPPRRMSTGWFWGQSAVQCHVQTSTCAANSQASGCLVRTHSMCITERHNFMNASMCAIWPLLLIQCTVVSVGSQIKVWLKYYVVWKFDP